MADTEFSLEQNLEEIRSIVDRLQKGIVSFDEHLKLMQEGMARIQACHAFLDKAELTIEQLVAGSWTEFSQEEHEN